LTTYAAHLPTDRETRRTPPPDRRGVRIGFLALFALLLLAGLTTRNSLREDGAKDRVSHTGSVLTSLKAARNGLREAEASRERFRDTGSPADGAAFARSSAQVGRCLSDVARLTADDPAQQGRLTGLRAEVAAALAGNGQTAQGGDRRGADMAERTIGRMEDEGFRLLQERIHVSRADTHATRTSAFLLMGFALLLLCLGTALIRHEQDERTRVEATLRLASTQHASLAAAISDLSVGVLISDPHQPDNPLVFVNPAFSRITGYASEEVIGRNPRFMTDPNSDPAMLQRIREAMQGQRQFQGVMLNRRKDGTLYRNSLTISPVFDASGGLANFVALTEDVTAQYGARQALPESERRYAGMVANVPGMMCRVLRRDDGSLKFLHVSEGSRTLVGIEPERILADGSVLTAMIHPADRVGYLSTGTATSRERQAWHWQGRFVLPSGELRFIEGEGHSEAYPDGGLIWDVLLMDITEREANSRNLAQLAAIVEGSHDAIKGQTLEGIITSWNPAAEAMYGYTAAEMIGQTIDPLLATDRPHEAEDLLKRIAQGERVDRFKTMRRTKDGSLLNISLTMSPIRNGDGQVIGASSIAQDITAQHHAEERLRVLVTALENANDVILITEAEPIGLSGPRVVYVNEAFTRVTGYEAEEILGQTPRILQGPDTDPETRAFLRRKLAAWEPAEVELLNYRKDGTAFWSELNIRPVANADGWYTHWVAIQRDVTERRRTEDDRRHHLYAIEIARDAAQAATQAKSEFLANMSHEIRTPMNGVIGMAGLLLETPLSLEQQDYAQTIRGSGDALLTIINDILDFSKIEAGMMTIEAGDFSLRESVEDVAEMMSVQAHAKGLEMNTLLPPGLPESLRGDAGRIRQILTNFLGNAVKFTEHGEVMLEATLLAETPTHATLCLAVRDTGIGIPRDRQEAIFESFTQADGSTTRRYGGTGLGLTVCRQLVILMDGRIGVESNPGNGSRFWIELTLEKGDPAVSVSGKRFPESLQGSRALIVDDNAPSRSGLGERLRAWGMRTAEVSSGEAAIAAMDAATADPFGLVLVDMAVPGSDGGRTARALRADKRWGDVPLILLASSLGGSADHTATDTLQRDGFTTVLLKPVRQSSLFNTLIEAHLPASSDETVQSLSPKLREPLGLRVLLAEDNSTNQKLARRLLEKWGCRADAVANGQEALAALAALPYDMVLMDVQMPEMDGLKATEIIRYRESRVEGVRLPIIAMTANAMDGDRELCLTAGMDDYVSKPINPRILYDKMAALSPLPGMRQK
jgi:PAS domain S-box-containing protein